MWLIGGAGCAESSGSADRIPLPQSGPSLSILASSRGGSLPIHGPICMRNTGLKVGSIRPLCRAGGPPCPAVARCRQTAGSPIGVLAWRDDISMCQNVKQTHTGYGMGGSSTANFGACGGVCSPLCGRWSPGLVLGSGPGGSGLAPIM